MKRTIISKQDIATEISSALQGLARDIDHDRDSAIKIAASKLSVSLRSDEVFALLKLISEDRVQCGMCGSCVPESRASGAYCLPCACKMIKTAVTECEQ